MKLITANEKAIRAEILKVKERQQRFPKNKWASEEIIGRCLRYLGDSSAQQSFQEFLDNYKTWDKHPDSYLRQGIVYRLSGDHAKAQECFEHAQTLLAGCVKEHGFDSDIQHLIQANYLSGRDKDTPKLIVTLKKIDPDTDINAFAVAKLAEARCNKDTQLASEVVTQFEKWIRRYRSKIWESSGPTLWDWYEIAVETWESLSGEKAER